MGNKLFIGGLAWATTEDGLREAFEPFGEITEVKIVTDRDTGRSRGFGFVSYTTETAAQEAVDGMNGKDVDGRTLRVDLARDQRRGGPPMR